MTGASNEWRKLLMKTNELLSLFPKAIYKINPVKIARKSRFVLISNIG